MSGTFYGIGVGPGDPELLTIKAVKTIEKADVVIVPKSQSTQESTAFTIAKQYIKEDAELLPMVFPMVGKQKDWVDAWQENAQIIAGELEKGKNVIFLTLGDAMFYSTYIYVFKLVKESGYNAVTIPGITAFAAIASGAGFPLVEGDDVLTVLPATADQAVIDKVMDFSNNLVVMKVSHNKKIIDKLKACGYDNAVMVSRCGLPDEKIVSDFTDFYDDKLNYLSTILARKN